MSEKKTGKKKPSGKSAAAGRSATTANSGPMNVDLLQQIVTLMATNDLNTVDVRDGDRRIILKRGAQQVVSYATAPAPTAAALTATAPTTASKEQVDENAGLVAIKSPMVGTFYSRPNPESKSFITVNAEVDNDTDVCIIEAMKTFNTIKAEVRGSIAKILVTDGQTVDVGKPLFLVKPS